MTVVPRHKIEQSPDFGGWTLWSHAGIAVLMPTLPADLAGTPAESVYMARVEANLTGECPLCRAQNDVRATGPKQASGLMEHESDCPVATFAVEVISAAWPGPAACPSPAGSLSSRGDA